MSWWSAQACLASTRRAHHLQSSCPSKRTAILEGVSGSAVPGTCSATRAFAPTRTCTRWAFRSGRGWAPKTIADGESILGYIQDTARENDLDRHIRFGMRLDARELFEGEVVVEAHRLEARAAAGGADALAHLLLRLVHQRREQREGAFLVAQLARHHLELEGRARRRQHAALAVDDLAARRRDALGADRVALRALEMLLALDDLELEEPHHEEREEARHHDAEDAQALVEEVVAPGSHAAEQAHRSGAPASKRSPPRVASGDSTRPTAASKSRLTKGIASGIHERVHDEHRKRARIVEARADRRAPITSNICATVSAAVNGTSATGARERELSLAESRRRPREQLQQREEPERAAREEVLLPADAPGRDDPAHAGHVQPERDGGEQRRIGQHAARHPGGERSRRSTARSP